jgi:hypothetical protein
VRLCMAGEQVVKTMLEEVVWKCMAVCDVFKDLCLISAKGLVYSYSSAYVCVHVI